MRTVFCTLRGSLECSTTLGSDAHLRCNHSFLMMRDDKINGQFRKGRCGEGGGSSREAALYSPQIYSKHSKVLQERKSATDRKIFFQTFFIKKSSFRIPFLTS